VQEWIDWYLSDDIVPYDALVKRFSDGLGDRYPQDDVAAAVHEAIGAGFFVGRLTPLTR
jgi:hypothetical protein